METMTRENLETRRDDVAESIIRTVDNSTTRVTRVSIFHILTIASIGASIALFLKGRREEAIFVGLWPPTFEALKSAAERRR
ncbi:MAG: hypothetical protein ACLFQR_02180 [Desulfovibrionales bacterium]